MSKKIRPVILSGGSGTRMWPLSRQSRPKQFHSLISEKSMLQDALLRMRDDQGVFDAPILLANQKHRDLIKDQLQSAGIEPGLIILEPMPRNTAPAIAALAVAAERENSGEILVVLPADHAIADEIAFRKALEKGAPTANEGAIVTFGVEPTRPETGYGYIRGGDFLKDGVRKVQSFEEKPTLETAERYVASEDYYWNAGIFMFRSDVMIEEMEKRCPKTLEAAEAAVTQSVRSGVELSLDPDAFAGAPEDSIDYAVMEHTDKAAVLPISVGWSDIGSWGALWEILDKDEQGNAAQGDGALFLDCTNTLAMSDGQKIAAIGVEDLLIVATKDGVLVARRDRAQDVKKVVERLKSDGLKSLL